MTNLILMAGRGLRFIEAGYKLPKPLIMASGQPMIYLVIDSLPQADKWVFVVRKEHVEEFSIDKIIKNKIKDAVIVVDDNPIGQASSAHQAIRSLSKDEDILIASCDNAFIFDHEKFEDLRIKKDVDMVMWTFTQDNLLIENPKAWGWVKLENDRETIADMSVKVPVSNNPFNDHAVVATFYFKKAQDFIDSYDLMVKENYRINNEFYIDSMPIFLKKLSKKSVIFDVDLYVGWGKPSDLRQYEYLEFCYFYKKSALNDLWIKYFDGIYGKK